MNVVPIPFYAVDQHVAPTPLPLAAAESPRLLGGPVTRTGGVTMEWILAFFIAAVMSISMAVAVPWILDQKPDAVIPEPRQDEDEVALLKAKVSELEGKLFALQDEIEQKLIAGLSASEDSMVSLLERMIGKVDPQIEKMEIKVRTLGERMEESDGAFNLRCNRNAEQIQQVEKKLVEVEKKIPGPPKLITVSMEEIQMHGPAIVSHPRQVGRRIGPVLWSQLQQPRLLLNYRVVPTAIGPDSIATAPKMEETITSTTFSRIIPSGNKVVLEKAEVWHSTPGLVGNFTVAPQLQALFDA